MTDRVALKRLTASDLTVFEPLYRTLKVGNQKAINLNADVFITALYPAAPQIALQLNNEFPVTLSIFGPGHKGGYKIARKIIKNPQSYKNWRLNGEFIHNPEGDSGRFNIMQPDDLALMAFSGDPAPTSVDLYLIASSVPEDARLYSALLPLLSAPKHRSMIPMEKAVLAGIIEQNTGEEHPVRGLLLDTAIDAALEDAALGGAEGMRTLLRRRVSQRISQGDLKKARASAERIGRAGEELVNAMLHAHRNDQLIADFEWVSQVNAISPFDFRVTVSGKTVIVDAKATEGPFERVFHISLAEIIEAAQCEGRYDIYRVYDLTEDGGKIRIAEGIREFAAGIVSMVEKLPKGITPDSFSINPAILSWGKPLNVSFPDMDE